MRCSLETLTAIRVPGCIVDRVWYKTSLEGWWIRGRLGGGREAAPRNFGIVRGETGPAVGRRRGSCLQRSGDCHLLFSPSSQFVTRVMGGADCNPVKRGVFGLVDHAHAPLAELFENLIMRYGLTDHESAGQTNEITGVYQMPESFPADIPPGKDRGL